MKQFAPFIHQTNSMRNLILFIATSLDGYIARSSGEIDWLFSDQDYGYSDFLTTIDTVLMGRRTYDQVLTFGDYPYPEMKGYVFSRREIRDRDENVKFISNDVAEFIKTLKCETGKDIWLVGGAEIVQECLRHELIDQFMIYVHPIVLGEGIPLWRSPIPTTTLQFQSCESFDTGLVKMTYKKR